jgi:hypothetical protein
VAAPGKPGGSWVARTADSSRVVAALRPVLRGSAIVTVLVRLGRSLSGRSSWIAGQLARHPPSRDFPHAMRVVTTSRLLTAVDRFFLAVIRGWEQSAVRRVLIVDSGIMELETWEQVRLLGWVIVVATLTHGALAYATVFRGWRGLVVWIGFLTIGFFLIAACRPVAVAWRNWRRPPGTPSQ